MLFHPHLQRRTLTSLGKSRDHNQGSNPEASLRAKREGLSASLTHSIYPDRYQCYF